MGGGFIISVVDTIKAQVDLVDYAEKYTELNLCGETYRGICPVCQHNNNSEFTIYKRKTFHCWACGASGDVIDLHSKIHKVDFYTSIEYFAEELNLDIKKDTKYIERKKTTCELKEKLEGYEKDVKVVADYLTKARGLTTDTIKEYHLGSNNGNVVIPFINDNGVFIGWANRRFEGVKYLNSKNSELFTKSEFLFGMRQAKSLIKNELYLVEGYFCAMSLFQDGKASVAYNSSQPTRQQLQKISKLSDTYPELTVMLIPDNDEPARNLIPKVRENVQKYCNNIAFTVIELPNGIKDVNELYVAGGKIDDCNKISLDLSALVVKLNKCSTIQAERKTAEKFAKTVTDALNLLDISIYLSKRWNMDADTVKKFLNVSLVGDDVDEDFKDVDRCIEDAIRLLDQKPIEYGFSVLDEGINGGCRLKDVSFIGGYSSVGKTQLVVQMALDMVCRQKLNVLFFSLEMDAGALYERVIAGLLGRPFNIVDEMIRNKDPLIFTIKEKLKKRLFVIDKNNLDIGELDKYIKIANAKVFENGVDVVFVDYIQYMKNCSDYNTLAETAKGMKPLAKDNNIHVVVLSQLNRGSRIWEKPSMADLKGGGDLEASADNILLMWKPCNNPSLSKEEVEMTKDEIMVGVGKARRGTRITEVKLKYDHDNSRYIIPEGGF